MITIRRITEHDADLLREMRLRALRDTPTAFSSTYVREAAFDAEEWHRRAMRCSSADNDATFFAFEGDQCGGIIGCFQKTDQPNYGTVVSMWVANELRRKGLGTRLLLAVEDWARKQGRSHLFLDVVDNNASAVAFYEKFGFRLTGETSQYPNDPRLRQLFMLKRL